MRNNLPPQTGSHQPPRSMSLQHKIVVQHSDTIEKGTSSDILHSEEFKDESDNTQKSKGIGKLFRKNSDSSSDTVSTARGSGNLDMEHREFEMTYDMMLGIRTVIGKVYSIPQREITKQDFEEEMKYFFPKAGSSKTPAHKARDFRFKDYHPQVFRNIREHFGIDAAEYTMTVTDNQYLEFISNSKSGQFFFYTHNKQFMIKTMSKEECKFLRKILPDYYNYIMQNPNTLLTRYYGIHRVKPSGGKKIRFLIMGSVFFTENFIHENYDIKGSTIGRSATEKEKQQEVPVYKDLDFLERKIKISIARHKAQIFVDQISKDAHFLESLNIMDYSLLLGMHYTDRKDHQNNADSEDGSSRPSSSAESKVDIQNDLRSSDAFKTQVVRRQSHYGLRNQQEVLVSQPPGAYNFLPAIQTESFVSSSKKGKISVSIFNTDEGGVRGMTLKGTPANVIYYVGIIDILQQYNAKKKLEHSYKSLSLNSDMISAVKPSKYADRFISFIKDAVDLTPFGSPASSPK